MIDIETQICKTCKYFHPHYGLGERGFFRLSCGHCTLNRPKNKRPDQKACADYIPGEYPENAFATREYLLKSLLDRVMRMELLPNTEEGAEK